MNKTSDYVSERHDEIIDILAGLTKGRATCRKKRGNYANIIYTAGYEWSAPAIRCYQYC